MKKQILLLTLFILGFSHILFGEGIQLVNLNVEYEATPLGIDVGIPRFSWQMATSGTERGLYQKAYQIEVREESGEIVWDSGKREKDVSINIEYAGSSLKPTTRYSWTVLVWDQDNNKHSATSWFETGLMDDGADPSAWDGAKWIGGDDDDMVLYADYLPVFKINYTVQLDEKSGSTKAGFVYGANDPRLMDQYKNLYKLENKAGESYLMVEVDIAPLNTGGNVVLKIYRSGYHPDDQKEKPFHQFQIPSSIINKENKYQKHTVHISSNLGYTHFHIDGEGGKHMVGEVNLNPLGRGGDFIAFPVVGDIGFSLPKGQSASFSNLEIRNFRSPSNTIFSEDLDTPKYNGIFSEMEGNVSVANKAYQILGGSSGAFILADPSQNAMPMLRTTFISKDKKITKARLYVTSRGVYDVYLNGHRIGNDYFNPGLTQYNKTQLYQTYDVTELVHQGDNAIGAILGEGWWSGGATYMGENWNFFGDGQSLLAKMVITYSDGTQDVITSRPDTWSYYDQGPIVYGSFFQGEVYDAGKEKLIQDWSTPAYDDSAWKAAKEVFLEGNISHEGGGNMPKVDDYTDFQLIGQTGNTVKAIKELTAQSVEEARPGVFVYDMGQNMVGVPKISLSDVEAGTKIALRFAEVKYPDLPDYKGNEGMIMLENIRAAMAQDIYITKGGKETIQPRFTFHGYRYIEITGLEEPLPIEQVKGTVLSSVHEVSSFYNTSNPKVNKLWENITWSTYGNFLSIPTDCPQRNERLGWSGDISVFSRTATYLAHIPQFLRRHMRAMRDVQREDGRFTDVAPLGGGFGGVLWGSAGITVAWESYQQYGDKRVLEEHYVAMKDYIHYILEKNIDPQTNILEQENPHFWGNLGDWLGPEQEKNDNSLLWEAYFIYDLELMGNIASVLGKQEDEKLFAKLYQQRKEFFNATYVSQETGYTVHSGFKQNPNADIDPGEIVDTQASYVLPLAFNVISQEQKENVFDRFRASIVRENLADNGRVCPPYSLMTGFIGTAWISPVLSENGQNDIAYRLLQQTSYPSWLYSVEQGATTIWERLNSFTHTNGFGGNNRMNSFNHYSFGAVGAWMYSYTLGIQRGTPGFKTFILRPYPDPTGQMKWAEGHYDSMYGRIESKWDFEGEDLIYQAVVPPNTSATLILPVSAENIQESGVNILKTKGVSLILTNKNESQFKLESGTYKFKVNWTD